MIFYVLSVLVFFAFVAALVGMILFLCILIDAFTIWWGWRRSGPHDVGPCACGCGRIVPVGWDGMHGAERRG